MNNDRQLVAPSHDLVPHDRRYGNITPHQTPTPATRPIGTRAAKAIGVTASTAAMFALPLLAFAAGASGLAAVTIFTVTICAGVVFMAVAAAGTSPGYDRAQTPEPVSQPTNSGDIYNIQINAQNVSGVNIGGVHQHGNR